MRASVHARILGVLSLLMALVLFRASWLYVDGGARVGAGERLLAMVPATILAALGVPPLLAGIGLLLNRTWGVILGAIAGLSVLRASLDDSRLLSDALIGDVLPGTTPPSALAGVGIAFAAYAFYVTYREYPRESTAATRERKAEKPAPRTRPELRLHVRVLGVVFLALAVAPAVHAITPVVVLVTEPGTLLPSAWPAIVGACLLPLLLIATGVGLLRERRWALFLGGVPAMGLFVTFPVGTTVAVYIGWALYRQIQAASASAPRP